MSRRLIEKTKPRHTVQLNRNGKKIKLQDTTKENNIFCFNCEKRFSVLETYFSRVLIEINSLQNAKRRYSVVNCPTKRPFVLWPGSIIEFILDLMRSLDSGKRTYWGGEVYLPYLFNSRPCIYRRGILANIARG